MCVTEPAPILDPDDSTETVWWGGLGQVGDKFTFLRTGGTMLEDTLDRATAVGLHELGHNLGLRHASSLWSTPQPITTVGGTTFYQYSAEYGDRFDRMGSGRDDFNTRYKQWLHWLGDDEVPLGTTDGVYYLNDHDNAENGGLRGLQVPFTVPVGAERLLQVSLFVEYRTYPSNALLRAGPTVRLTSPISPKSFLLDGPRNTKPRTRRLQRRSRSQRQSRFTAAARPHAQLHEIRQDRPPHQPRSRSRNRQVQGDGDAWYTGREFRARQLTRILRLACCHRPEGLPHRPGPGCGRRHHRLQLAGSRLRPAAQRLPCARYLQQRRHQDHQMPPHRHARRHADAHPHPQRRAEPAAQPLRPLEPNHRRGYPHLRGLHGQRRHDTRQSDHRHGGVRRSVARAE